MHLLALTACLLLVVKMSEGAVAVGVGRLNPGENPSFLCIDHQVETQLGQNQNTILRLFAQ